MVSRRPIPPTHTVEMREEAKEPRKRRLCQAELIIDRMIKADEEGSLPPVRDLIVGVHPPGVRGATPAVAAAARDQYTQSRLRGPASVTLCQTIRSEGGRR